MRMIRRLRLIEKQDSKYADEAHQKATVHLHRTMSPFKKFRSADNTRCEEGHQQESFKLRSV